jgi:hypothetical protein
VALEVDVKDVVVKVDVTVTWAVWATTVVIWDVSGLYFFIATR